MGRLPRVLIVTLPLSFTFAARPDISDNVTLSISALIRLFIFTSPIFFVGQLLFPFTPPINFERFLWFNDNFPLKVGSKDLKSAIPFKPMEPPNINKLDITFGSRLLPFNMPLNLNLRILSRKCKLLNAGILSIFFRLFPDISNFRFSNT